MAQILMIDDEPNIRMMVRLTLMHAGHNIETATDGPEGLQKFGDGQNWDLVLLDQRMPEMEGLEVLREIKLRNAFTRVIMITAFGTIDLAVEAMKAGARDFLRKPFTADTLRGAVNSVLDGVDPVRFAEEACSSSNAATRVHPSPLTFSMSTINGYWIESRSVPYTKEGKDISYTFTVNSPVGEVRECRVLLPAYVVELVKAQTDCEQMPGGARFWHALCEEVVANYVWQHSEFPPDGFLRVDELSAGLKRWIDAVLSAGQ